MKLTMFTGLALGLSLSLATAASAQESSYTAGGYSDVTDIDVLDGQMDNYMDYLATSWKKQQEFAKSKGYITGYAVLSNPYARAGEPDLFLVVNYDKIYDAAEERRQDKEFEAFMKADSRALGAQSAGRATMRTRMSQTQLRVIILK